MKSAFVYCLDVALSGFAMIFGYMFTAIIIIPFLRDVFNF